MHDVSIVTRPAYENTLVSAEARAMAAKTATTRTVDRGLEVDGGKANGSGRTSGKGASSTGKNISPVIDSKVTSQPSTNEERNIKSMKNISLRGLASASRFKHITETELRTMNIQIGSEGAFLVPDATVAELMRLSAEQAVVRPRAQVFESNPKAPDAGVNVPAVQCGALGEIGGITAAWVPDGDLIPPSADVVFREVQLRPNTLAFSFSVSDKLLRNSSADKYFSRLAADALAYYEDLHFFTGTGILQPLGIIGHAGTIEVNRTAVGNIAYADCVNMLRRLMPSSYNRAQWYASPSAMEDILTMVDPNGNLIVRGEGTGLFMLGRRLTVTNRLENLGASGDLLLADFNYYGIKDGVGLEVAASADTAGFLDNVTMVRVTANFDGRPLVNEPLQLRDGVTVSPFVTLT